ncbi:MAG: PAS domain-containing sensor histidine kinase, partial [Bdellovibrionales bacterium]
AKGFGNRIFVVAQASEAQVFAVVRDFSVRTLLFGMLVLTIVILAAFLLSRSLTGNIAMLAERMEGAARGDLSTHIHLHGRDETVILANTFNQMIEDLRTSRDALEEVNRDLDQKVKDRTAELEIQNRKVKEVQEALLRTTRLASVGEIAGRTAHEVLNPLTILLTRVGVIQKRLKATDSASVEVVNQILSAWISEFKEGGFEKLLASWQSASQVYPGKTLFEEDLENIRSGLTGVSDGEAHLGKDIQFIKEEGERIAKIINNMRRLGISKSDLRKESIHTILKDCCEIMADLFQEKGFLIDRRFEAQFDECSVDRDEVVQAVTNLMRNSLQALAERAGQGDSSVRPFVRLQTHNEDGKLVIDIEDNGVGIRDEHQQELFKSSFTTKSHDEGTGLGLGIARRFIRGHGGDIDFVSSVPLDKTVFRIVLPLAADDQQGAVA